MSATTSTRLQTRSAKIVLATYGTSGDVLPYIAIARELRHRGHRAVVATAEIYREAVEEAGVRFVPIRPPLPDNDDTVFWARAMCPTSGTFFLYRFLMPQLRAMYDDLRDATRDCDLLISHSFFPAAPILAEATRTPWISCVLSPLVFNSQFDPPTPSIRPQGAQRKLTGKLYARWFMKQARRQFLPVLEPVFEMRRELHLPTDRHPLFEGQHSPLRVLALFSPLFAQPQPDWPQAARVTGFCIDGTQRVLDARLQQFLDSGDAPIVFTPSANSVENARDFWRESLKVVTTMNCRALWIVGSNRDALPPRLLDNIGVFSHVPLAQVLSQSRAIVHHGGAGTIALSLRAGLPMLMVPQCHDQPTNAVHAARLGSGRIVWRHDYKASRVARELRELLSNPLYAQRAKVVQSQINDEDGVQTACDEIEKVLRRDELEA